MSSEERHQIDLQKARLPLFLYGTAWKEDQTQRLTELAVNQGFRGIDTANQRKHYDEAAVGQAIQSALKTGRLQRDDLFLQTKFTFQRGQDHRLPYDPREPISSQVEQSFASSLDHFGVDWLDSYVLHGPSRRVGLISDDWEAWRAMEGLHDSGRVRWLGISNISLEQLQALYELARIRPTFVQNRCYAVQGWDRDIREFCGPREIVYQGFSLLTANRDVLVRPYLVQLARDYGRTPAEIVFRFARDVGMLPLTGTTSLAHMQADLSVRDFTLTPDEVAQIEGIASS